MRTFQKCDLQRVTDTSKGKRDASNEEANYETGEPQCVGLDLAILAKARRLTYLTVIV